VKNLASSGAEPQITHHVPIELTPQPHGRPIAPKPLPRAPGGNTPSVPYGFSPLDATHQKTLVTRLLPANSVITQVIQILTTDIASESGNKAPLLGDEAPLLGNKAPLSGNKAPLLGNKAPLLGNKAPLLGNEAPPWGNEAPLWGNRAPLLGDEAPPSGNTVPVLGKSGAVLEHSVSVGWVRALFCD
jgi:hypothetical protein